MGTDTTSPPPSGSRREHAATGRDAAAGDADPPIVMGRLIAGKYRIEGVLGKGGMGVVVAARQLDLDRPVAIKFLRRSLTGAPRGAHRFAREARAIAKMRSEHVVRVFDIGEDSAAPFIVMERLVGCDLATELARGPLPVEVALKYLLEACEAIAEAHSLGIVHRDLKPSNLFVAETVGGRRTLKVLDFGVSKWLEPASEHEAPLATGAHGFVGTPAYVSPEQLTDPESVDQRADVWALGVVLYQCLAGRLPFTAETAPRLCAAILTAKPRALAAECAPAALVAIVLRCLEKSPEDRYPSVAELARALVSVVPQSPAEAPQWIERLALTPASPQSTPAPARTERDDGAGGSEQSTTVGVTRDGPRGERLASAPQRRSRDTSRPRALLLLASGSIVVVAVAAAVLRSRRGHEGSAAQPARTEQRRVQPIGSTAPAAKRTPVVAAPASAMPMATASFAPERHPPFRRIMPRKAPRPTPEPQAAAPAPDAPNAAAGSPSSVALPAPVLATSSAAPPEERAPANTFDTKPLYRR